MYTTCTQETKLAVCVKLLTVMSASRYLIVESAPVPVCEQVNATTWVVAAHGPAGAEEGQHALGGAVAKGKGEEAFGAVTLPCEDNGRTAGAIAGVQLRVSLRADQGSTMYCRHIIAYT